MTESGHSFPSIPAILFNPFRRKPESRGGAEMITPENEITLPQEGFYLVFYQLHKLK